MDLVNCQICFCSSTFEKNFTNFCILNFHDPFLEIYENNNLELNVKQFYLIYFSFADKKKMVENILKKEKFNQCFIFLNFNEKCVKLYNSLKHNFSNIFFLHENSSKKDRKEIMKKLKNEESLILITMDYLFRGLHLKKLDLVINYDLPKLKNNYINRIGRVGRFKVQGTAISFFSQFQRSFLEELEDVYEIEQYKKIE